MSMAIAKKGYRGVSVPASQEDHHQLETALLAGYLALIRLKSQDPLIVPLMSQSENFRNAVTATQNHGKIVYQEVLPDDDEDSDQEDPVIKETFKHHIVEYMKEMCSLGSMTYSHRFKRDYWPNPTLIKENQVLDYVTETVKEYHTSMGHEWPGSCDEKDFEQLGRCAGNIAFNEWESDDSAFMLSTKLYTNVCARIRLWEKLQDDEKQNPRNEVVLDMIYAAAFHKQAVTVLLKMAPRRQHSPAVFFTKIGDTITKIVRDYTSHFDQWTDPEFCAIINSRQYLLDTLPALAARGNELEQSIIKESIGKLHTIIRPHSLTPFATVKQQWDQLIKDTKVIHAMFTSFGFESQEVFTSDTMDLDAPPEHVPPNASILNRRQLAKEKKKRDLEELRAKKELEAQKRREQEELEAQKRREEEELAEAKKKQEEEARAEKKRLEEELRAAKKKKEEEEWAEQQKRLEEKRNMQKKMEHEAKVQKKKEEQERIQKIIEERNRARRAEEEKRNKERAEREERDRIERERVAKERAEREERERIEQERLQKEQAERRERERIQAETLANAQNAILEAIARDPTKLDPKFMLKFMQTYAPSLVRFASLDDEDDTAADPLMGTCQICFDPFNTTDAKKPLYLKCCAQSLCAGCMQKVLNKPHRHHRLEFDEDDALVQQWAVMRRALGLPVPKY